MKEKKTEEVVEEKKNSAQEYFEYYCWACKQLITYLGIIKIYRHNTSGHETTFGLLGVDIKQNIDFTIDYVSDKETAFLKSVDLAHDWIEKLNEFAKTIGSEYIKQNVLRYLGPDYLITPGWLFTVKLRYDKNGWDETSKLLGCSCD